MALVVKELTDELEKQIEEKCKKNGYTVWFHSFSVFIDDERDIMFIPCGGRGTQDEPRLLEIFHKNARIRIVYEDYSSDFLLSYDVVSIEDIPSGLEKHQVFEFLTEFFECYTKHLSEGFAKYNPNAGKQYNVEVKFDRCRVYEK